jgi:segregation and condensation protein B
MGADLAIELEERVNGNGRHGTLIDATLPQAAPDDASGETDAVDAAGLGAVIESLLLASGSPVPLARLVEALDGPDRREVAAALRALGASYERGARGFRLVYVAGGYQLRSAPEHARWVRRLLGGRPPRLSRPLLETLAIVAYRQPCTRPEIEAIRGVDADAVLASLVERRLIRILGRKDAPGRPILYGTTKEFLEVFDLPDLQALPPLGELGEGAEGLVARAEAATGAGADGPAAPGDEPATDDGRDG